MKHLYNYYKAGNEPLRTNSFCVCVCESCKFHTLT